MEKYCQNPLCDTEAVKEVKVSVQKPADENRSLCACCEEVFVWGVQHGKKISRRQRQWILAIADRGIIAYAEAYLSKKQAEQGLIDYLRKEENYDGPDGISEAANWLAEHDERLSAEIFKAESCYDSEDTDALITLNKQLNCSQPQKKTIKHPVSHIIAPPPEESGPEPLWRVIYTIDVNASDANKAALAVHNIMKDPESWAPILEVMDSQGHIARIDLSEMDNDRKKDKKTNRARCNWCNKETDVKSITWNGLLFCSETCLDACRAAQ